MYLSETTRGRTMGSLRRDHVTRIPIDLDRAPISSFKSVSSSSPVGTSRIFINSSSHSPSNFVSAVRSRVDSVRTVGGTEKNERHLEPYSAKLDYSSSKFDGPRKWSSVSSAPTRETGSILKKPESGGGGGGGGNSGGSSSNSHTLGSSSSRSDRTPQGRRRVRFTNDVAMYRFDSDGVDSTYSSSEYERLNAVEPTDRKASGGRHSTASIAGNSSRVKVSTDDYDGGQCYGSSAARRTLDDRASPFPGQQYRGGARILHGTPNGSLYLRNSFDRVRSMPSVHWLESSPKLGHQDNGSINNTSCSVKSTSYALVSDSATREKKLIISAKLSETIQPSDITIKANKNGSKIRIVSTRSPPIVPYQTNALAQQRHQINEQIILPVNVNPYRLTARLEPNGSLHIEAPYVS